MDLTAAKTRLKQYCEDNGYDKPAYEVVSKRLDDVRKIYKVRVTVEGLVETTGEGYSRRLGEHRAAVNALKEINEVREEQRKSKEEEKAAKDLNESNLNKSNESKVNENDGQRSQSSETNEPNESETMSQPVNGDHTDRDNSANNNNRTNSIIISADINTSAEVDDEKQEEETKANGIVVNGHNSDDQSQSSSQNSNDNDINGKNNNNFDEDIDNNVSNDGKINGKGEQKSNSRTFPPLTKTSVQILQDFCMSHQSPFPFYDSTFKEECFRIKCRIEFTINEEKREFFGTGSGDTIKGAKLMAANDIIEQLTENNFIN